MILGLDNRFGSKLEYFTVECHTAAELGMENIQLLYELTDKNMKEICIENGYEWVDEEEGRSLQKMQRVVKEMNSNTSHYILVRSKETQQFVGYADIRFRIDWLHNLEPVIFL